MKEIIEKIDKLPDIPEEDYLWISIPSLKALASFARDAAEALKEYADDGRWDHDGEAFMTRYFYGETPCNGGDRAMAVIAKHAELLKETK